ncbi:MAG: hypothetical protein Q3979_00730 [Actinomycetaceae bacterium]|nr:hypothetical protein [Actinomycetaceae bacterium]
MNIWLLPDSCKGEQFLRESKEILGIEPFAEKVRVDSTRAQWMPLAYSITRGMCDCGSFIGNPEQWRGEAGTANWGRGEPAQIKAWLDYLLGCLGRKSRIGLIRTWTPGKRVEPQMVTSVPLHEADEKLLRGLEEDELLVIRFSQR